MKKFTRVLNNVSPHSHSLLGFRLLSFCFLLSLLLLSCARSKDTYERTNKEVYYTVIFDLDGGGYLNSLKILKGEKVTKPKDPTKIGATFVDWYKDSAKTEVFDFSTENITANTTIYVKWGAKKYTVTYDTDGGSAVPSVLIEKDMKITPIPTNPTKNGVTFVNWYKDTAKTVVFDFTTETITENITIYVKWEPNKFTVTYNTDAGSVVPSVQILINNKITPMPTTPTKTGYIFVNWFKDSAKTMLFDFVNEMITSNITIYAKWEVKKYSINYTLNGGTLPPGITNPQMLDEGTTIANLPKPTNAVLGFAGWFTDTTTMTPYAGPVSADITLYAKWVTQFEITYNLNGGMLPNGITSPQRVNEGTLATNLPTPTNGYNSFDGWFTDTALTIQYAGPVTADATLNAKWTPKLGVDLILRGGAFSGGVANPILVTNGDTPSLPTTNPTRVHKKFMGWYDATTEAIYVPAPLTANKKLYAKWEREKFNLTYEIDGGSFTTEEQAKVQAKVKYNLKPKLPTPNKAGAYFLGWFKDSAKTMPYNGEKMTEDLTLYAKWATGITAPSFVFTKADNSFLTDATGVSATIDRARNIIWFPLGNGLTAASLSNLNPTISNIPTKTLKSGTRTDFLAPQIYSLTLGGIAEDYQVQVQPKNKTELTAIITAASTKTDYNFIDTSKITDMSSLFSASRIGNVALSRWDVSSVQNMTQMFFNASFFNSDISDWDTSSVTDMTYAFNRCETFNQNISLWDVSSVVNTFGMLANMDVFNQDLSFWDVSSVTNMGEMLGISIINSDISTWDTSKVTNMRRMLYTNTVFNQDISTWDVSKVTDFAEFLTSNTVMIDAHKPKFN